MVSWLKSDIASFYRVKWRASLGLFQGLSGRAGYPGFPVRLLVNSFYVIPFMYSFTRFIITPSAPPLRLC